MATYKSSYTGPQIDQAVGNALNKDTSTLSNDVNHIPASSVVKSAIGDVISVLFTTTVTLPNGTNGTTDTSISLASFLDANGYELKGFSYPMLGNYALPYSDGTAMRTYISGYDNSRNLHVKNNTTAWNNYAFKVVLFCQKT